MFRFTIRELVLLTLAVAMGIGWWLDRGVLAQRLALRENHRSSMLYILEHVLQKEGYTITDHEYNLEILSPKGVRYVGGLIPPGKAAATMSEPSSPQP